MGVTFKWYGDIVQTKFHDKWADSVDAATKWLYDEVERIAPVDTGILQSKIKYQTNRKRLTGMVKADARYSGFVHEGFAPEGPRRPQPFMRDGFNNVVGKMERVLGSKL